LATLRSQYNLGVFKYISEPVITCGSGAYNSVPNHPKDARTTDESEGPRRDVAKAELWDEERLGADSEFSKAGKGRSYSFLPSYRNVASVTL
jgi:hypothetical protein